MALRLRHVPSGKYLSVDSTRTAVSFRPAPSVGRGPAVGTGSGGSGSAGDGPPEDALSPLKDEVGGSEAAAAAAEGGFGAALGRLFDCALVHDADPSAAPGALGSAASMLFHLMPTDVTGETLRRGVRGGACPGSFRRRPSLFFPNSSSSSIFFNSSGFCSSPLFRGPYL